MALATLRYQESGERKLSNYHWQLYGRSISRTIFGNWQLYGRSISRTIFGNDR